MDDISDLTRLDLHQPGGTSLITDALSRQGMAVLCGLSVRVALLRAGRSLMTIKTHRDSDGEGVTTIERRLSIAAGSLAGFTDRELVPNTDGSAVLEPPQVAGAEVAARLGVSTRRLREVLAADSP